MNLKEIKKTLTYITSMFFAGASVIWAEQINTKPVPPYVVLKFGSVQRTAFPAVNEDLDRYYPCSTTVEINLYTKGKPIDIEENVTGNNINTAVSDMLDFFNFIESDTVIGQWLKLQYCSQWRQMARMEPEVCLMCLIAVKEELKPWPKQLMT